MDVNVNNMKISEGVKTLKLSDQAMGAVMMALQKSLLEQSDIVPVLKGFDFVVIPRPEAPNELTVLNPPAFKVNASVTDDNE